MSDAVTTPVSPFEEKAIDHADPREHAREPRIKPRRLTPHASHVVDVPREVKQGSPGLPYKTHRTRYSELFLDYLPVDLVRTLARAQPASAEMESWVRDVIEPGVAENMRGRFILFIDPAYQRWTLGQIVNTKRNGQGVARCAVFAHEARPNYLPADLDDERFRHLRGRIGDFKVPDRRDFEEMREKWDRRIAKGEETGIRAGATNIAKRIGREKRDEYNDKNRVMNDQVRDMLEYNFRHVWQAANNGTKQWSNETITPQRNPRKWRIEQKQGYALKTRIPPNELRDAETELDGLIRELFALERADAKQWDPSESLVRFANRTLEDDADVFALIEEGREKAAKIRATREIGTLEVDGQAAIAQAREQQERQRHAQKLEVQR